MAMKHYKGNIGEFDYDDEEFELVYDEDLLADYRESIGERFRPVHDEWDKIPDKDNAVRMLNYIGNKDPGDVVIPHGILKVDNMFSDYKATFRCCGKLPKIPEGVESARYYYSWYNDDNGVPELPSTLKDGERVFFHSVFNHGVVKIPEGLENLAGMFEGAFFSEDLEKVKIPHSAENCETMFSECIMTPEQVPIIPINVKNHEDMFYKAGQSHVDSFFTNLDGDKKENALRVAVAAKWSIDNREKDFACSGVQYNQIDIRPELFQEYIRRHDNLIESGDFPAFDSYSDCKYIVEERFEIHKPDEISVKKVGIDDFARNPVNLCDSKWDGKHYICTSHNDLESAVEYLKSRNEYEKANFINISDGEFKSAEIKESKKNGGSKSESVFINGISNKSWKKLEGKNGEFYQVGVSVPKDVSENGFVNLSCNENNVVHQKNSINLVFNDKSERTVSVMKDGKSVQEKMKMSELAKHHENKLQDHRKSIKQASQKGDAVESVVFESQKGLGE